MIPGCWGRGQGLAISSELRAKSRYYQVAKTRGIPGNAPSPACHAVELNEKKKR